MRFATKLVAALGLLFSASLYVGPAAAELRCPQGVEWTDEEVAAAVGRPVEMVVQVRDARSLDNYDLCTMPKGRLERAFYRLANPKPDHPGEWAKFRAMQLAGPDGKVKPDGLIVANEQRRAILEATESRLRSSRSAGISSQLWTPIGPGNIGGRVRALLIHPDNPNQIWAGSVSGGIWTTYNGGADWTPVNDFMGNLSITSLVMSPFDSSVMYAATGEGFFNADAVRGAGIFKSTDGGVTWAQIASTNPVSNPDFYYVNRLSINPTNQDRMFAATNGGVYRSDDGGTTWEQVTDGPVPDVKINPSVNSNVIAGSKPFSISPVRYSTDSGTTWNDSNLSGRRAEIAFAKTSNIAYASIDNNSGEIWKSTDNGQTWTRLSNPRHLGSQGWYDNVIWVDPTNANHLIIGGIDLFRSTNGGTTWTKISIWWDSDSVHADQHAIVSSPAYNGTSNRTVFFGNDGGVYKAVDINAVTQTTGWTDLNNGLAITQFYSGAGHEGTNGRIIGGTQDNGSLLRTGTGTNWTEYFGGDGGWSAIDPTDGNYIYGEYVYLKMHRSTNGGLTTNYIDAGIGDAGNNANFIAPFHLDPNNPNTMLAGGRSLWRSLNLKAVTPTWSNILPNSGGYSKYISQIAIAEGASNVGWIGRNDGTLHKSTNLTAGSPTFSTVAGPKSDAPVLSILIDKANSDLVYIGYGGYARDNLWRTTDGGATWTSIGGTLPESPVRAIQRHPSNSQWLYAGTEVGIFASEDGGATWGTTNDGPANVSVDQLFWLNPTTLVAATHGRGMFKAATFGGRTLSIVKAGGGTGTVVSAPAGINCGSTCTASFSTGSSVKLTATPTNNSTFTGWTGGCTGTATTCTVSMTVAKTVTATFAPGPKVRLSVVKSGTNGGLVLSAPIGINCGPTCAFDFALNGKVTLSALPFSTSVFSGWGGACSGTSTSCTVTMNAAKSVTAVFNAKLGNLLSVTRSGAGFGTVTSSPIGISCGSACTARYAAGRQITLTATPASNSYFVGWGGHCTGTSLTCRVTMSAARNVSATFQRRPVLTVSKIGTGTGSVQSVPAGINCGSTCTSTYSPNARVSITAVPAVGSRFVSWSGNCTGSVATCVLSMNGNKTATANFLPGNNGIGDAVEAPGLVWTTGGNANWFPQRTISHAGGDAARAGAIGHNQSTYVQTSVVGPGTLSFYWYVQSRGPGDKLTFSANNVVQPGSISGSSGWVQKRVTVPTGRFTLRWTYVKDGSLVAGADTGFLDSVVYTPRPSAEAGSDGDEAPVLQAPPAPAEVDAAADIGFAAD